MSLSLMPKKWVLDGAGKVILAGNCEEMSQNGSYKCKVRVGHGKDRKPGITNIQTEVLSKNARALGLLMAALAADKIDVFGIAADRRKALAHP
jgi:hypothetical protein